MAKFIDIALLLDFYSSLLTEKQCLIMSYYYEQDMSLSEISENLDISRQAVHDLIKRSEKTLYQYEENLGLVKKFIRNREMLQELKYLLRDESFSNNFKDRANEIVNELLKI